MSERNFLLISAAVFSLLAAANCARAADRIIYVDDSAAGANDGLSWDNAYICLQDALADANSAGKPIEIRVAQGIYKPDQGAGIVTGDKEATFKLIDDVILEGNYAGVGSPDPNACNIELYKTILSGDLADNDTPIEEIDTFNIDKDPSRADNSLYIVTASRVDPNTCLEGLKDFVITAATRAGLYLRYYADINIDNCVFINNTASGIICDVSKPYIRNCIFEKNVKKGNGGGICIESNSYPKILHCTFKNNWAQNGGGLYNEFGRLCLEDCTFINNMASDLSTPDVGYGGGICSIWYQTGSRIKNCLFINNVAVFGGGVHMGYTAHAPFPRTWDEEQTPLFDCTFISNSAFTGGAISQDLSTLDIQHCIFRKNSSVGAISVRAGTTNLTNCLFSGNSTDLYGASIFVFSSLTREFNLTLNACTFAGNLSPTGRTLYCSSFGNINLDSTVIMNCILDNEGDEIQNPDGSRMTIDYTNLRGGINSVRDPNNAVIWGIGNVDADPLFANPSYWADANDPDITVEPDDPNAVWIDGDYHLKSQAGRWDPVSESWVIDDVTSPCIDAGDPNSPVGEEPEPNGGRINMGAYGGMYDASKSYLGEP